MRLSRSFRMAGRAAALVLVPLLASGSGAADPDKRLLDILDRDAPSADPANLPCCGPAYNAEEEPEWMNRVLTKLANGRPKIFRLRQHLLLRNRRWGDYLALIWTKSGIPRDRLQIYKVKVLSPGNVRLSGLVDRKDHSLSIDKPSGEWADDDGSPLLVVSYWDGGMWFLGSGVWIFRLSRGLFDVTPRWAGRFERIADIDGDGDFELVVSEESYCQKLTGR